MNEPLKFKEAKDPKGFTTSQDKQPGIYQPPYQFETSLNREPSSYPHLDEANKESIKEISKELNQESIQSSTGEQLDVVTMNSNESRVLKDDEK